MTLDTVREAIDAPGEPAAVARRARNAIALAIVTRSAPAQPRTAPIAELQQRFGDELGGTLARVYEGGPDWTTHAIDALEPLHRLARVSRTFHRLVRQNRPVGEERVYGDNVFVDELPDFGNGVRGLRMERTDDCPLVCAVWELEPGATVGAYHLHHGTDELLIVLRGRATVRTPDGERELDAGSVLQFPRGLEGAHQLSNRGDEVLRYVMAAYHGTPEVIEYPDENRMVIGARTPGADGEKLFREI